MTGKLEKESTTTTGENKVKVKKGGEEKEMTNSVKANEEPRETATQHNNQPTRTQQLVFTKERVGAERGKKGTHYNSSNEDQRRGKSRRRSTSGCVGCVRQEGGGVRAFAWRRENQGRRKRNKQTLTSRRRARECYE